MTATPVAWRRSNASRTALVLSSLAVVTQHDTFQHSVAEQSSHFSPVQRHGCGVPFARLSGRASRPATARHRSRQRLPAALGTTRAGAVYKCAFAPRRTGPLEDQQSIV